MIRKRQPLLLIFAFINGAILFWLLWRVPPESLPVVFFSGLSFLTVFALAVYFSGRIRPGIAAAVFASGILLSRLTGSGDIINIVLLTVLTLLLLIY